MTGNDVAPNAGLGGHEFGVESILLDGVCVVTVVGEVDLSTAPLLADELERVRRHGVSVVVDLCGVTFIDSSGLHVLVAARRDLSHRSLPFAVACATATSPARLLEMIASDQLFETFTSRAAAVDKLGGRQ